MKILNGDAQLFAETIIQLPLKGKQQRLRTRLFDILKNHIINVIEKERVQLIEEHAVRNENGEIIYQDVEQKTVQIKDEFYSELNELLNEYFHIEMNENNKELLLNIANILLDEDCPIECSGEFALVFNQWCEECERVIEFYNKQSTSE